MRKPRATASRHNEARQIRNSGFDFKLFRREGDIAVFQKTMLGLKFESFEVVIIQGTRRLRLKAIESKPASICPPLNNCGDEGWTYSDRPSQRRKFDELRDQMKSLGCGMNLPPEGS
jgi:hypothetical protein